MNASAPAAFGRTRKTGRSNRCYIHSVQLAQAVLRPCRLVLHKYIYCNISPYYCQPACGDSPSAVCNNSLPPFCPFRRRKRGNTHRNGETAKAPRQNDASKTAADQHARHAAEEKRACVLWSALYTAAGVSPRPTNIPVTNIKSPFHGYTDSRSEPQNSEIRSYEALKLLTGRFGGRIVEHPPVRRTGAKMGSIFAPDLLLPMAKASPYSYFSASKKD